MFESLFRCGEAGGGGGGGGGVGKQKRAKQKGIRNLLGYDKSGKRKKKDFRTLANSVFLHILLVLSCYRLSRIIDIRISILLALSLLFGQITQNNYMYFPVFLSLYESFWKGSESDQRLLTLLRWY